MDRVARGDFFRSVSQLIVICALNAAVSSVEAVVQCSEGVCVPFNICSGSIKAESYSYGIDCPGKLVCCREASTSEQRLVNAKVMDLNKTCDGTCVLPSRCAASDDSGIGGSCPATQICCKQVRVTCDGVCTPSVLCADADGEMKVNVSDELCPAAQMCCKKLKSHPDQFCSGVCVFSEDCAEYNTGIDQIINLRLSDGTCPANKVCCNGTSNSHSNYTVAAEIQEELCEGECVPLRQCTGYDHESGVDLRLQSDKCPRDHVCCQQSVINKIGTCDGTCIPQNQCDDIKADPGNVDLRFNDDVCPVDTVCCRSPRLTEFVPKLDVVGSCEGECIPRQQCLDSPYLGRETVDLRISEDSCPVDQVCCRKPQKKPVCDYSCVPVGKCNDSALEVDLRFGEESCPLNEMCCKNPKIIERTSSASDDANNQSLICEGKCVSIDECADHPKPEDGINLRTYENKCSNNFVCCKNLKSSILAVDHDTVCNGSCVPVFRCLDNEIEPNIINLRQLPIGGCSFNEVCCTRVMPLLSCDGICTEYDNCLDESLESQLINLRSLDEHCPSNQICCKRLKKEKTECKGKCVPYHQCYDSALETDILNLRSYDDGCPKNETCCKTVVEKCNGNCDVQLETPNINRLSNTKPSSVSTENKDSKQPQCTFAKPPSKAAIRKSDVPWLVNVWSHRKYLDMPRDQFECVGTLLTKDLVLTSADCVADLEQKDTFIRIGDFNLKPFNTLSKRREYTVNRITVHPDYNSTSGYANVAVLKLSKNSTVNAKLCLSQHSKDFREKECFVVGWNKHDMMNDSITNAIPRKQPLALADDSKCNEGFLCAVETSLRDDCGDQQGSPILCFAGSDRRWEQAGLATKKCEPNNSSLIAIDFFNMWIREQISPSFQQIPAVPIPSRVYLPAL